MQLQATDTNVFAQAEVTNEKPQPALSLTGYLLLPLATFVIALLTIDFSHRTNFITTLWLANAVILFALLHHIRSLRNFASILAGGTCAIFLANLAAGNAPALSALLSATNGIEVATAWALLLALKIDASSLTSFRNMLIFIVAAGGIAPLGSDAITAMAVGSAHNIAWHAVWMNSYPAHALGAIIVTPFLISLTSSEWQALLRKQRRGEALAMLALVIAIGIFAAYFRAVFFVVAPALLLLTVRFGIIGATAGTFLMAIIFSGFIVMGIGQPLLSHTEISERILGLQVLMVLTSLWSLPVAALLTERNRLLANLSLVNSQLHMESERKSHMVTGLHRHLSIAEEKERLRLSHELHDQAGQSLVAAILELSEIDPIVEGAARQRLHLIRKRIEEMGKTLHRIAWELRPPSIGELGLSKALASYIEDWGEQCATEVDFHCDDASFDTVPNDIGSAVFRVVQEALTNIVKHAQKPANVGVVLRRVNSALQVIIEDDGCGFDAAAMTGTADHHPGLGLDGMRERLLLIGGTLEVESSMGAGTTIFARIPLQGVRSAA